MPAWASRRHWLDAVLPAAAAAGRDVLRRHHIAPVTFLRVMALHALHADDDTGRGCTIDVEHLRLEAGCSERTVQRARAAARELGVAVEVLRGRHLNLEERIAAYEAGSKQRGWASVYALGCPSWLACKLPQRLQHVPDDPQVREVVGERGTPPVGRSGNPASSSRSRTTSAASADALASLDASDHQVGATSRHGGDGSWPEVVRGGRRPHRETRRGPSSAKLRWLEQRAHGQASPNRARRRPQHHPDAVRLASAVRAHVPALRTTGVGRLIPAVTRFATCERPWTAAELIHAAFGVAKTKGFSIVDARVRHPAAWWAGLLAGLEHAGLPADHEPAAEASTGTGWQPAWPTASATRRGETHWDAARRHHHDRERARRERDAAGLLVAERRRRDEERDERAGRGLCEHGAGGAADTGRSPRCALCRAHEASSPDTVTAL